MHLLEALFPVWPREAEVCLPWLVTEVCSRKVTIQSERQLASLVVVARYLSIQSRTEKCESSGP